MREMFKDINDETKEIADIAWRLALAQHDPIHAANFLNTVINYYSNIMTEEEIEFLHFYFNMKMEMMNE